MSFPRTCYRITIIETVYDQVLWVSPKAVILVFIPSVFLMILNTWWEPVNPDGRREWLIGQYGIPVHGPKISQGMGGKWIN